MSLIVASRANFRPKFTSFNTMFCVFQVCLHFSSGVSFTISSWLHGSVNLPTLGFSKFLTYHKSYLVQRSDVVKVQFWRALAAVKLGEDVMKLRAHLADVYKRPKLVRFMHGVLLVLCKLRVFHLRLRLRQKKLRLREKNSGSGRNHVKIEI